MVLTLSAILIILVNALSSAIRLEEETKGVHVGKDDAESTYLKVR